MSRFSRLKESGLLRWAAQRWRLCSEPRCIFPTEGVGTAVLRRSNSILGQVIVNPVSRFSRLKESGLLRWAAQRLRRQRQLNDRGSIFPTEGVGTASLPLPTIGARHCAAVAFTGLRFSEPRCISTAFRFASSAQ